jgi:hypothetical protein
MGLAGVSKLIRRRFVFWWMTSHINSLGKLAR